ncbi:hypothetical protein [Ramlibacter sp.]|uniref:hypothetical protein n=1 Tax=Ramlibacter sp. TaxID=1917967 RepID=UPI00185AB07A|nr:hypothetical protein [Ramlibacter sp.]MBA2675471.1 hypothetical protein [Ramlibacter sp.]
MANEPRRPAPALNPLQNWTDLSLRMLDWMVSSRQRAGDQADRMARGGAGVRAQAMAQAWRQWFDLLGTFGGGAQPAPAAAAQMEGPAAASRTASSRPRASARGKSS